MKSRDGCLTGLKARKYEVAVAFGKGSHVVEVEASNPATAAEMGVIDALRAFSAAEIRSISKPFSVVSTALSSRGQTQVTVHIENLLLGNWGTYSVVKPS